MGCRKPTEVRRSSGTRTVAGVNQIGYKGAAVRWTHNLSDFLALNRVNDLVEDLTERMAAASADSIDRKVLGKPLLYDADGHPIPIEEMP